MTGVWIFTIALALAAGVWIARPFLRRGEVELNEADCAISIFRDQADEVKRDLEAGLISEAEYDAAREEIEMRALNAAKSMGEGLSVSRRSPRVAACLALVTMASALAVYAGLGDPAAPDQPLEVRKQKLLNERASAGDLKSQLQVLIEKTKADPKSFQDWWMLARTYSATGDHASAADAYRRAAELSGDRPTVLSSYAESMTLANGNKVPKAAKLIFQQILQKAPDPRARYYIALSKAQAQDFTGALDDWAALYKDSKPGAPWVRIVRRDIINMSKFTKRDVTKYLPDATPAEIAKAKGSPVDKSATLARISEIEENVAKDPKDYKGWIELAELNAAAGQNSKAVEALENGRKNFAAAPFVLGKFGETARRLGLDLIESPKTKGPTDADVAAMSKLSQSEQDNLIRGMVAGLAAKLEANPNNPDGWIMLVRSYTVTGDVPKARKSYETAMSHFKDDAAVLSRLQSEAGKLLAAKAEVGAAKQ